MCFTGSMVCVHGAHKAVKQWLGRRGTLTSSRQLSLVQDSLVAPFRIAHGYMFTRQVNLPALHVLPTREYTFHSGDRGRPACARIVDRTRFQATDKTNMA
jgi:hypothetical protein